MKRIICILCGALLGGCVTPEQRLERIAYEKCGPDGAVDWDDNPSYPPPHCNRNGWNGREYVEPEGRR